MSETPAAHVQPTPGTMERLLGAIERGGNRMPSPAILFVWLCVGVVVLSTLLSLADIKVTYQVAKPPPVPVEEYVQGGSTQPSGGLPDASVQEGEYKIVTQTAAVQSLLSADGIRFVDAAAAASQPDTWLSAFQAKGKFELTSWWNWRRSWAGRPLPR